MTGIPLHTISITGLQYHTENVIDLFLGFTLQLQSRSTLLDTENNMAILLNLIYYRWHPKEEKS